MRATMNTIWWTAVGFGPCDLPALTSTDRATVAAALEQRRGRDASGWTGANSRVYGYATRRQARDGDISDGIGKRGRVA